MIAVADSPLGERQCAPDIFLNVEAAGAAAIAGRKISAPGVPGVIIESTSPVGTTENAVGFPIIAEARPDLVGARYGSTDERRILRWPYVPRTRAAGPDRQGTGAKMTV